MASSFFLRCLKSLPCSFLTSFINPNLRSHYLIYFKIKREFFHIFLSFNHFPLRLKKSFHFKNAKKMRKAISGPWGMCFLKDPDCSLSTNVQSKKFITTMELILIKFLSDLSISVQSISCALCLNCRTF